MPKIAFPSNSDDLSIYTSPSALENAHVLMKPGTSPVIGSTVPEGWMIACQNSVTHLCVASPSGLSTDTEMGMMAGTSPSIAGLSGGGWMVAFQANTSDLWTYSSAGKAVNTKLGMMAGTSPSIGGLVGGGWMAAFQANTGILWTYSSAGAAVNTHLPMMAGTSPCVAGLTDGSWGTWGIAFQAITGNLYVLFQSAAVGVLETILGMAAGTSPSITGLLVGGWVAAVQANTGYLYTFASTELSANLGYVNSNLKMAAGTSPSITGGLAGEGWTIACQGSTGDLCTYSSAGASVNTGLAMMAGTSPAVELQVAAAPVPPGPIGLGSNSNYDLYSSSGALINVSVTIDVTEDIVWSGEVAGFSFQLNGYSGENQTCVWQQYVMYLLFSELGGAVENWTGSDVSLFENTFNLAGMPISGVPAGYSLLISLENDAAGNVTGATYVVTGSNGNTIANVNQSLLSISGVTSADLAPIYSFQLNLVGPDDLASSTLSSGAGTITYSAATVMTASGEGEANTGETANSFYGPLPALPSYTFVQAFDVSTALPMIRKEGTRPSLTIPRGRT